MERNEQSHEIEPLPVDELVEMAIFVEDISGSAEECADNLKNLLERNDAKLPINEVVYVEGYVRNGDGKHYLAKDSFAMTNIYVSRDDEHKPRLLARCLVSDQAEGNLYTLTHEQKFITFLITDMQQMTSVSELFLAVDEPLEQIPAELDEDVLRDYYRGLVTSDKFRNADKDRQEALISNMIDMISERSITHGDLELKCRYFMIDDYEDEEIIRAIGVPDDDDSIHIVGHTVGITHGQVPSSRLSSAKLLDDRDLMIAVQTSSANNLFGYDEGDIIFIPIHQKMKIIPVN